jgi:hypothetical protein
MEPAQLPTAEYLHSRLAYDAATGVLTWRHSAGAPKCWNSKWADREAFTAQFKGYRTGRLDGKQYLAHRLIWALCTGKWPAQQIDHINGNRSDNRIANLREVSNADNAKNASLSANNTSGVTGVWLDRRRNRWCAEIKINRRKVHLGSYSTREAAARARKDAEIEYAFHPNHGMPATTKARNQ